MLRSEQVAAYREVCGKLAVIQSRLDFLHVSNGENKGYCRHYRERASDHLTDALKHLGWLADYLDEQERELDNE